MISVMMAALLMQAVPAGELRGEPTEAQFERAREALDDAMLDFTTARFRAVRADGYRICGMVNARNALGAYTGWKPFGVMDVSEQAILRIDDPGTLSVFCTPALHADETDYSDRLTER